MLYLEMSQFMFFLLKFLSLRPSCFHYRQKGLFANYLQLRIQASVTSITWKLLALTVAKVNRRQMHPTKDRVLAKWQKSIKGCLCH